MRILAIWRHVWGGTQAASTLWWVYTSVTAGGVSALAFILAWEPIRTMLSIDNTAWYVAASLGGGLGLTAWSGGLILRQKWEKSRQKRPEAIAVRCRQLADEMTEFIVKHRKALNAIPVNELGRRNECECMMREDLELRFDERLATLGNDTIALPNIDKDTSTVAENWAMEGTLSLVAEDIVRDLRTMARMLTQ